MFTQRKVSAVYESLEHGFRESEGYVQFCILYALRISCQSETLRYYSQRKWYM